MLVGTTEPSIRRRHNRTARRDEIETDRLKFFLQKKFSSPGKKKMATVSDPSSSCSSSSTTWTDPYKEFELYLEKANVSFLLLFVFFFAGAAPIEAMATSLVDAQFWKNRSIFGMAVHQESAIREKKTNNEAEASESTYMYNVYISGPYCWRHIPAWAIDYKCHDNTRTATGRCLSSNNA